MNSKELNNLLKNHFVKIDHQFALIVLIKTTRAIRNFIIIESIAKKKEIPSKIFKEKGNKLYLLTNSEHDSHDNNPMRITNPHYQSEDSLVSTQESSMDNNNTNTNINTNTNHDHDHNENDIYSSDIDDLSYELIQELKELFEEKRGNKEEVKQLYNSIEEYCFTFMYNEKQNN